MKKTKKLIIAGDSAFAEVAFEMFQHDSEYEVVAFAVSKEYITKQNLFGLPIIPFEDIEYNYSPTEFEMYIALVYNKLNRNREKLYNNAKQKGYTLANYVSSRAFVWKNVEMGDNVFIFENNVVQPFVKLGSNLVLWSGNHIGHHSTIDSHCFIASHVVISGFVNIGKYCFFGVNATVGNNVNIGDDCLIGAGAMIVKDIPNGSLLKGPVTPIDPVSTWDKFGIEEK